MTGEKLRKPVNGSTHCGKGHKFTPENTAYKSKTGWRYCRECNRIASLKWFKKNKLKEIEDDSYDPPDGFIDSDIFTEW